MGSNFSADHQAAAPSLAPESSGGGATHRLPVGLADLPESCVALILSYLEPLEICRLASVNRNFRQASSADCVWEQKLPQNYKILVTKFFQSSRSIIHDLHQADDDAHDEVQVLISTNKLAKKDIYAGLCCPTRFNGDTMEVWMDKVGGGLCVAISWKGLKITGISDRRYWNFISTDDSRFEKIAYLKQIWWLEVEGNLELEFPAGTYSLYFRMHLGKNSSKKLGRRRVCINEQDEVRGWDVKPVRFHLSSSCGHQTTAQHYLDQPPATAAGGQWINYRVGDFVVHNKDNHHGGDQLDHKTKLKFSMAQIDCTHTKGGLCLDCVLIYPTHTKLVGTIRELFIST
ncbi:OLC1v1027348C2 [Oldenlandia corymbosa var. corymbosa]|uniref:OLC1v1027348C2 n=1 Tax=Oldenlandia corymbosa var. corymbosa TaxID=529605 RepID=A0AAV1CBZ3_OLDCO|nr:OLC1v1027348C2 [Oldenlandia corymbosa var. corymbosa]